MNTEDLGASAPVNIEFPRKTELPIFTNKCIDIIFLSRLKKNKQRKQICKELKSCSGH